jgi:hypothetical protein
MILTLLGLAASAAFAGAALYVNVAEQPARLELDDRALLKAWKPSYAKGLEMQATLPLVGGVLGIAAFFIEHRVASAIAGALMLANWPYTFLFIMPTNKRLDATPDEHAGPETRTLVVNWGRLHAVRTGFGLAASVAFLLSAAT